MRYGARLYLRGNLQRVEYFAGVDTGIDWAHTFNDWDEIRITTRNVNSKLRRSPAGAKKGEQRAARSSETVHYYNPATL